MKMFGQKVFKNLIYCMIGFINSDSLLFFKFRNFISKIISSIIKKTRMLADFYITTV